MLTSSGDGFGHVGCLPCILLSVNARNRRKHCELGFFVEQGNDQVPNHLRARTFLKLMDYLLRAHRHSIIPH